MYFRRALLSNECISQTLVSAHADINRRPGLNTHMQADLVFLNIYLLPQLLLWHFGFIVIPFTKWTVKKTQVTQTTSRHPDLRSLLSLKKKHFYLPAATLDLPYVRKETEKHWPERNVSALCDITKDRFAFWKVCRSKGAKMDPFNIFSGSIETRIIVWEEKWICITWDL